ncbi:MAG: C-GCAxxG-C-C family protein [Anaerolineae bacterium]|nr:C-GCAxxG-C-C family protein [Anaerolineae bacterium]
MLEQSMEQIHEQLGQKVMKTLSRCGNCAQTSFLTLQEQFELDDGGAILKALTAMPGVALRGETCGAVIGPLMALGLIYGRDKDSLDDFRRYQRSLPSARRYCREFEEQVGSTKCAEIIEEKFGRRYDLSDPGESMEWLNAGAVEKCGEVICKGVWIASEIMFAGLPALSQEHSTKRSQVYMPPVGLEEDCYPKEYDHLFHNSLWGRPPMIK